MSRGASAGVRSAVIGARVILGLVAVGLVVTGCTTKGAANREPYLGTATASPVGGVQEITLTVDSSFRFTPSTFIVHPGRVRVVLHHLATGSPHNWQLTGIPGAYVPTVDAGQTDSVTFEAPPPGRYPFVCTIHERQGQTGVMTVLPT